MASLVILLSGPVCAGKSSLAADLQKLGCHLVKTHELIASRLGVTPERGALQEAGERLDRETAGQWVADELGKLAARSSEGTAFVVDSVRIKTQIDAVRHGFGRRVAHVHLTADESVLSARYATRSGTIKEFGTYAQVHANPTEAQVETLQDVADILIRTDRNRPEDILVRVASRVGLYGREAEALVDVIVGGQYGSEGKGQVAAYVSPEYDVLVRVGGPNAGHKVFERPLPFTFHSLPSGSRVNEHAQLVIGPGAVIAPDELLREVAASAVSYDRLSIDPSAMIIEPYDRDFEAQTLTGTIGSTGRGVGSATARKVLRHAKRTKDEPDVRLARDVKEFSPYLRSTHEILDEAYATRRRILLEGTQGSGLSLHHGYYPHVTSRDTTASGCLAESGIAPSRVRRVLMVCRTYPIRVESPHDASSGPMGTEITWDEVSRRSGIPLEEFEQRERTSTTNRKRRVGEFDWHLLRRMTSLNGPSDIALTFVDYIDIRNREARRFDQLTPETVQFVEEVQRVSAAPVSIISTRFHYRPMIDRRNW